MGLFESLGHPLQRLWQRWERAQNMGSLTDDLHAAWQERAQRPLTEAERELIQNALVFSGVTADDVCVPRADICGVGSGASFSKVVKAFEASKKSRLLVHGKSLDEVVGVITLKDMIAYVRHEEDFALAKAMHPPVFVPQRMPVPRVLQMMRRHRVGLVVVTDEYGGTAGLLTLKDLMVELVGDILDEHGTTESEAIQSMGGGRFRVPATLPLETVTSTLSLRWPVSSSSDVETIGGLILHQARRVPQIGEDVPLPGGVMARVLTGNGRKLELLELKLPEKPKP